MQRIIVQIYEIQTPAEAEKLIALGVDHVGSVVMSEAQWKIPQLKETIRVVQDGGARSSLIPLFNNSDSVYRTIEYYQTDMIHFCEDMTSAGTYLETSEKLLNLQKKVKKKFPQVKIIRSIPIARPGMSGHVPTLELSRMFEPFSDFFLTDTLLLDQSGGAAGQQPVKGFVGITGQTCDWGMAAKLVESSGIPVILAGGITPENAFNAAVQTRPAGIDSCTGTNAINSKGGVVRFKKDLEKVKQLVDAVRRAEKFLKESR